MMSGDEKLAQLREKFMSKDVISEEDDEEYQLMSSGAESPPHPYRSTISKGEPFCRSMNSCESMRHVHYS